MEIVLLHSAQADILGLISARGEAEYHVIERELEKIRLMPEIAPIYSGRFRRKVVRSTTYGIFYSIQSSRIIISFILDLRQDPSKIIEQLG